MLKEVPVSLIEPTSLEANGQAIDCMAWGPDLSLFLVSFVFAASVDNNSSIKECRVVDTALVDDQ